MSGEQGTHRREAGVDGDRSWLARLDCPIPPRISPHVDDAQEWLVDWTGRFTAPLGADTRDRTARGVFARYAARLYPEASATDLRVIGALFTWFFMFDDASDTPGQPRPVAAGALRDGVLRLLRDGVEAQTEELRGPLRGMLVDAWQVLRQRMAPPSRARFTDAVAHYLEGLLTEVGNKAAGRTPSVAEYVPLRRATSAAYVSYTLIEFTTGRPLPDAVYHHPAVRELAAAGNDLLSWFNDLLSLDWDVTTSGGHNLVLAVAAEQGLPVAAAVDVVVTRWQERMRQFVQLRAELPSFGPALDDPLRHHLDGVANSVRGTIDWSLESARYLRLGRTFTGQG
ncbi:terpene synthase family protein [Plantactinospora sp. CA-290183]|uniref:terpene synthase family protein n=1 Tax=Plantactinospora sp. CA-290183 TaxID=3240006 RepID=UPI003D940F67